MTIELERLSEQLIKTGYREGGQIVKSLAEGLSFAGLIPDQMPKNVIEVKVPHGPKAIQILLENARVGPYVDANKLAALLRDHDLTEYAKENIKQSASDIGQRGSESLYHLGLTMRENYPLTRHIKSISNLRSAIETGTIFELQIGAGRIRRILKALERFDELVKSGNKK